MGILDTFYILFDTDAKKAEREMADVRREGERTADAIDDSVRGARRLAPALDKAADNAGRLGRSFRGVAALAGGVLAGLAGANLLGSLTSGAETYTRFGNALRVAGLEGEKLRRVEDALFASSKRNGVELEGLSQLYSRVATAAGELGVNEAQILEVTDAVSSAIRVQGGDAAQASGAMLQLAQALGAGVVRAEEFNSITEGMLPLLQAAAWASDKYKGSVAKLRADVLAGNLTSKQFFDLIRAGSTYLQEKAAKAPLTVAQSMTALRSSMIVAVGRLNEAWGITRKLGAGLQWLSENLDTAGAAVATVATILTVAFLPAIWSAAAGVIAATWPILAIVAAALALGAAFALAYDDLKAFFSGQPSLLGDLIGKYGWLRAAVIGLVKAFHWLATDGVDALQAIGRVAADLFGNLMSFLRGWYSVAAPVWGLIADLAGIAFRLIGLYIEANVALWRAIFGTWFGWVSDAIQVLIPIFSAVFDAIGKLWEATFGRIVQGINIAVNGARGLLGLSVSDNASAAARGLRAGQGQLAGATGSPFAAQTTASLTTNTRNRTTQVNMGGVTVNAAGTDARAVPNALAGVFGDTAFQFDNGVAR